MNILVVLHKEVFQTDKLFALLVKKTDQENIYNRLGLIELVNSKEIRFTLEMLVNSAVEGGGTIIGSNQSESQNKLQYQTNIEQPPK
jgi:hypothetical protein